MRLALRYQQIASKMYKTHVLKKDQLISSHIPDTRWYNHKNLKEMLPKYPTLFIKPDKGGGGGGIIRLKLLDDLVECTSPYGLKKLVPQRDLLAWVQDRLKKGKRYMVQQGISLARIDQRPFDIRVHMQKPGDTWRITGVCAKVAAPGKIVTNHCKGGTPCNVSGAVLAITSESNKRARKILAKLYHLSSEIAKSLNRQFKGIKELGIDIGIDEEYTLWIFEVNTRPCPTMFRKLGNLSMYRKIKKIQRQF